MASWAIHFRIADYFLEKINKLDKEYFIIGNIAPDCGVPCEGGYNPPSVITHRTHNGNYKGNCDYQSIYEEFIKNENDNKAKSFWIGYFVHYVTDCLWVKMLCDDLEAEYGGFNENPLLSKQIRKEWYNLDFKFFNECKSNSFEIFKRLDAFNEAYPSFYKPGDISNRMKYIVDFYNSNKPVIMDYKYTLPQMVEDFVSTAPLLIMKELNARKIEL